MIFNRILNKKKYRGFNAVKMTVGRDGSENCEDRIEFIRQEETPEISENRNVKSMNKSTRKNDGATTNGNIKIKNETTKNSIFPNKKQYFEMEMAIHNSH